MDNLGSLNQLLKWGIENTVPSTTTAARAIDAPVSGEGDGVATGATATNNDNLSGAAQASSLNAETLAAIFGGPSEAELMKAAMELITDTTDAEITMENRLIAFDNFEQLIESLDNANNLENLKLWTPLLSLLEHEEREIRHMAAWCVGTAVQNNAKTQERLLAMGGVPPLVHLATHEEEHETVRRKAVYALSSAVRNYQPAMDVAVEELRKKGHTKAEKVDASNMDAVDEVIDPLRVKAKAGAKA